MDSIIQQIEQYKKEIAEAVAASADDVEQFRTKYLGSKGLVKSLMGEMKNVPADEKKAFGQVMN
jgi:phenylalanyl-tRNA synthetase alpha chain